MRAISAVATSLALLLLTVASGCVPGGPATPNPAADEPLRDKTPDEATPVAQGGAGPTSGAPSPTARPRLPAPLYLIDPVDAQVYRIGPDGASRTQVTFEAAPVLELAAAPRAAALAYLVGESAGRTLVVLDGGGRRELLRGSISSLAVSPDGQRLVYRLDDPEPGLIVGREDAPAGVWQSFREGPGRPSLVIADSPADGTYDAAAPAWSYAPAGFSPDGARLALMAYDADGPGVPGGVLVILGPGPDTLVRGPACCEPPAWSADGAALLAAGGGPGPDVRYGLVRTDARTGAEADILDGAAEGHVPLVAFPYQGADGRIYALAELAPAAGLSWDYPFRPRLVRVEGDDTLTALSEPLPWPAQALWAEDGSGVVVAGQSPAPTRALWVRADGATAVLPGAAAALAWGPGAAELAAGGCGAFAPLAYQAPAARSFSPGVRDVQARLASLGIDAGPTDGLYGERTRAAVEQFQRGRGLPPTGDVDCATWQALLRGARP